MADLNLQHLPYLSDKDPRLGETLQQLQTALNNMAKQGALSADGNLPAPAQPTQLNVMSAGGIFDIAITDNNPANTSLAPEYFLEYSTTVAFNAPTQVHLGPARNYRATLGNQTLYWRCYSQYGRASNPSPFTYFGSAANPTPVVGGGAVTGPNPLPSQGSGTGPTNGLTGGVGYGNIGNRNQRLNRLGIDTP